MFNLDICDVRDVELDEILSFGKDFGVSFDLGADGWTLICPVDKKASAVHLDELVSCWMSQQGKVRIAVRQDVDAVRIHIAEMWVGGRQMTRPFCYKQR